MLLKRALSILSVAIIAGASAACQLVLPDGGGGSGSTGTGTGTGTGSTGTGTDPCATSCSAAKIAKCDATFKTRCTEFCALLGTATIDCAVSSPNTACTASLGSQACKADTCAIFDTVCAGSGVNQCNPGNCVAQWLLLAQKYKKQGCTNGWKDACSQLNGSCADAASFNPQC